MSISYTLHALALALALVDIAARALRIRVLLPGPLWRALIVNTCGDALAGITPARWGGEPLRFLAYRRAGAGGAAVIAAFATEVCIDAVLIVALTAVAGVVLGGSVAAWGAHIAAVLTSPWGRTVVWIVLVTCGAGLLVMFGLRRLLPRPLAQAAEPAWRAIRERPRAVLASVAALTLVSFLSRAAILPVLAAGLSGAAGADVASLLARSFVMLSAQSILPVPAGAGAVDVGFIASFYGVLGGAQLHELLVAWRFYTVGVAAIGGVVCLIYLGLRRVLAGVSPDRRRLHLRHGDEARSQVLEGSKDRVGALFLEVVPPAGYGFHAERRDAPSHGFDLGREYPGFVRRRADQ